MTTRSSTRPSRSTFRAQSLELTKVCLEARDNVKFLTTLERHFKNLASGDLALMLDTLVSEQSENRDKESGPMFSALRMVWIISRHYSNDQRMGTLLERISAEVQGQVKAQIDIGPSPRGVFQARAAAMPRHAHCCRCRAWPVPLAAWQHAWRHA